MLTITGGCKDWLWVFGRMHERPATCQIHRAQSVHGWISTSKVGPCWGVRVLAAMSKQHQSAMWVPLLLELAKDHCYVKKHAPGAAGSYMGCNPKDDFPWPRDNSRKTWFCFLPSCWRKLAKLLQHLKSAALHDSPRSLEVQKVSLTLEIDQPEDWSNYCVHVQSAECRPSQWHQGLHLAHRIHCFECQCFSRCFPQLCFFTWLSCNAGTLNSAAVTKEAKEKHKYPQVLVSSWCFMH